jgi:hypothetical protein
MLKYIATFYTHSEAVKYRRYMERESIAIELIPVPRELSSDCGIGARFSLKDQDIASYVSEDMEKIFLETEAGYELIYKNQNMGR